MKPKRIQRKRSRGWRMPKNTVYVGRPGKWGNPYVFPGDAKKAVDCFEFFATTNRVMVLSAVKELRGKNLACWCPLDKPCHADVLLRMANA